MGNHARLGVLCLMVMAVGMARLVEVEFRPAAVRLGVEAAAAPGPDPEVQASPEAPPPPAQAVTAPDPVPAAAVSASRERTYKVQPGDTLGTISLKVYGTSHAWETIYEANRDRIPNPRKMRLGIELRIPPR